VKEVFEAQTLLNLPRFIMIFLCGVAYPIQAMPVALRYTAHVMPLTYTVDGLQNAFSSDLASGIYIDTLILVGFFVVFIFPAVWLLYRKFE
jgi:ABC-2 type transport system permease protein